MTNFNVKKIKELSKFINNYIQNYNNSTQKTREKKSNIFDGILFRLYYSQFNASQPKVTSKLNLIKLSLNEGESISRQAYVSREKTLPLSFYKQFYNDLSSFIDLSIYQKKT